MSAQAILAYRRAQIRHIPLRFYRTVNSARTYRIAKWQCPQSCLTSSSHKPPTLTLLYTLHIIDNTVTRQSRLTSSYPEGSDLAL